MEQEHTQTCIFFYKVQVFVQTIILTSVSTTHLFEIQELAFFLKFFFLHITGNTDMRGQKCLIPFVIKRIELHFTFSLFINTLVSDFYSVFFFFSPSGSFLLTLWQHQSFRTHWMPQRVCPAVEADIANNCFNSTGHS